MKKGDEFDWMDCLLVVTRVAKDTTWADFVAHSASGATWTKRMALPLPNDVVKVK